MICVFLEFIWKCFDKQVSVFYKRARPTGGQCGCFCSIRSPSMHLANPFTTCAIKSQPASVISFPTNFPARHFESILAFRYATHRRSSLDFFSLFFFAMRSTRARGIANEPTLLLQAGEKDQREIRIVHANANRRGNTGISLGSVLMRLFEMRHENVSLLDTHRRKRSSLISARVF